MPDRSMLQILNSRIIALEEEIHDADLILDFLQVPSQTKSGRDISLVGRLQWLSSYASANLSIRFLAKLLRDVNKPIFFSKN